MSLPILFKWIARLAEDRRASVAITFAFAVIPVIALLGLAVDYGRALKAKSGLQSALDSAAMVAAQTYSSTNDLTKATNTATANFNANAISSGLTLDSGSPSVTRNSDGSYTVTAQASVATSLSSMFGIQSSPLSLSSTAKMTHPLTPHSIVYQFQYAKGWYYKVVTLYVKQTSASTALPLATWTYKAYNDGTDGTGTSTANNHVAIPKDVSKVAHFWDSTSTQPTATGIGITTTTWNSANATTIGATLDSANNKITFNNTYYDLYLTMQINNGKCAPGQTASSQTVAASDADEAIFESVYKKTWSSTKLNENIKCAGTATSSFSKTVSTNSATNSNFLYINGAQQAANTALGLANAFPCNDSAAGTSVTNNYEWEDNANDTADTRDFFFSLTTTCTTNQWSGAPNIPKLTR